LELFPPYRISNANSLVFTHKSWFPRQCTTGTAPRTASFTAAVMNRKSRALASAIKLGVSFVRVGTGAETSSSLTPSIRSPRLTMHAMVSRVSGEVKCSIASRTRSGAARNRFTRPGSLTRSWSSRSAYCASANSPIVNSGFARITSTRAADPRSLIRGRAARTALPRAFETRRTRTDRAMLPSAWSPRPRSPARRAVPRGWAGGARPTLGRAACLDGLAWDATRARPPKPVAERNIRLATRPRVVEDAVETRLSR
jgi:hypothetical protein